MLKTDVHDHTMYKIRLEELRHLVETLGLEILGEFIQTRSHPYSRYLIGRGKMEEIKRFVREKNINLVVFYNILTSSQKLNLIRELGCDVVDRYEVTLEIFDRMASDNLSRLQIEAARLEKLAPYFKLEASLRFRNEHPFFRSMGEYAYHSRLREITRRQAKIRDRIETLKREKRRRIQKRRGLGYPIICISGFYNAGKTSLFNALTGEDKPVSPKPFTTLSSKYQRRYLEEGKTLLFIDTIGFVLDLDPRLIKSFELNLEDIRGADLVLLLLEINDPLQTLRMKLREGVRLLSDIGIPSDRIIIVFNKLDLAPERGESIGDELPLHLLGIPWIAVSAKERLNLDSLLQLILRRLEEMEKPELEAVATVEEG